MTTIPVVTRAQVAAQFRDAGGYLATALRFVLFAIGWTLAKTCRLIATVLGALLFGAGFLAGRVAWPALRWSGAAMRIGWQAGARSAPRPAHS
jgi:hypothetical protein